MQNICTHCQNLTANKFHIPGLSFRTPSTYLIMATNLYIIYTNTLSGALQYDMYKRDMYTYSINGGGIINSEYQSSLVPR